MMDILQISYTSWQFKMLDCIVIGFIADIASRVAVSIIFSPLQLLVASKLYYIDDGNIVFQSS